MKQRKARVYFLSDIDGRSCGVVAVCSRRQVQDLVPTIEDRSIHLKAPVGVDAEQLAMGKPGQLYVRPLLTPSAAWQPSRSRHPGYATSA